MPSFLSRNQFIRLRLWWCGCLVTWFCYQLIAKPGNKTATPPSPYPYSISVRSAIKIWPPITDYFCRCMIYINNQLNINEGIKITRRCLFDFIDVWLSIHINHIQFIGPHFKYHLFIEFSQTALKFISLWRSIKVIPWATYEMHTSCNETHCDKQSVIFP